MELARKMDEKEVWEGSHFRGRALADSLQTSCKLASRVGPKPVDFVAPVVALLCSRRLHNCRGRAGERIFEGYRLFEKAIVVIKPVGSLLSLVNALSLTLHSDTHLSRGTAQSVRSPSASCTSCPHDLIVIEYGKWMTSICNQHCLKIVHLTRKKIAISL